ncbi:HK97 gp10 family phage protein [Dinoroseobacter sp. S375]|uniref:HK97 gp10 family phage protein n=1 Tax=Dinoroseobacter sp. S375 TaxID=3415136 RepID=UPI003C7DCEF2
MKPTVTIRGLEDVDRMLGEIAPNQAVNIMRSTVHGIAGDIKKEAVADMPRDTGDMEEAASHKRRRTRGGWIRSDVLMGREGWYWRFLEYGQGPDGVEHAFFYSAVERFRRTMTATFVKQFGKKWEAALKRAARRAAK